MMIRMIIYKLYITRARILLQIHVSFLKSKTHALWYIGVSDDADSESGVFILHVLHISVISAGTSIFFSLFSDFSCIFSYFRFSRHILPLFDVLMHISTSRASSRLFFKPIRGMGQ